MYSDIGLWFACAGGIVWMGFALYEGKGAWDAYTKENVKFTSIFYTEGEIVEDLKDVMGLLVFWAALLLGIILVLLLIWPVLIIGGLIYLAADFARKRNLMLSKIAELEGKEK